MESHHDIVEAHYVEIAKTLPIVRGGGKNGGLPNPFLLILSLLTFLTSEGSKIVFRKNFGRNALRIDLIIISSIAFAGIAVFAFYQASPDNDSDRFTGTSDTNFVTGILYAVLALYIIVVGISQYRKSKKKNNPNPEDYQGDSYLLNPFFKDEWNQEKIQLIGEPLLILALGVSFCFIDLIAGIPLIFCFLSTWARTSIEKFYLSNKVIKSVNNQKLETNSSSNRNQAY